MTSMVIIFILLAGTVLLFFGRFAEHLFRRRRLFQRRCHRQSTGMTRE